MGPPHRQPHGTQPLTPRAAPLVLLFAALGGCAVDCTDNNWRQRGYNDGFGGHLAADLRIGPACGAAFSESAYMEGYRDGRDEWDRRRSMTDD